MVKDPATSSMLPWMVQFLHLMVRPDGLINCISTFEKMSARKTYSKGPVSESCPRDESGGRMAVLSHWLLTFAETLKLVGVDVGAAGKVTVTEIDVAAAGPAVSGAAACPRR